MSGTRVFPAHPPHAPVHPRAKGGSPRGRHSTPRRVRDLLFAAVSGGYYARDEQLVEDVLVRTLGATRTTVRHGLQRLAAEGVVVRRPGSGTLVRYAGVRLEISDIAPVDGDADIVMELSDQRIVPMNDMLRAKLDSDAETVQMVENTFLLRDECIGIRTAYYRQRRVLKAHWPRPMLRLSHIVEDLFEATLGSTSIQISSATGDERTCRVLGIPPESPLLLREQLVRDDHGEPVELVFDSYRADRVSFVTDRA